MPDSRIQDKIDQISQSKEIYLSEDAIAAKRAYDQAMASRSELKDSGLESQMTIFNENVAIMGTLFSKSRFDEMLVLLSKPQQLFFVNLLIGFFRGIGVVIGVILVLTLLVLSSGLSLSQIVAQFANIKP